MDSIIPNEFLIEEWSVSKCRPLSVIKHLPENNLLHQYTIDQEIFHDTKNVKSRPVNASQLKMLSIFNVE